MTISAERELTTKVDFEPLCAVQEEEEERKQQQKPGQ